MASNTTTQRVEISGLKELAKANRELGKDAKKELRIATKNIATATAREAMATGKGLLPVQARAADSIRARSGMTPTIAAGGSQRVTKRKTRAGDIWFGAEFGGGVKPTTQQFPRHRGQSGYFLWPTIRKRKSRDIALYHRACDKVCSQWGAGG